MADSPAGPYARACDAFARLLPAGRIGLAVSGGGDSMALLGMMAAWGGRELAVATVDHGLRRESADEAALVAEFCAACSTPHHTLDIGTPPACGNLSANLRDARYRALADWAHGAGIRTVLLGHTMDDQAETVLMRLARGSGAEGLSGMAETRVSDGITWIRPLLGLRRVELRDWLVAEGHGWADDPTNEDLGYDRIKARKALECLAPLGITIAGLAETAERLRRQSQVLQAEAHRLAGQIRSELPGGVILDRCGLAAADTDTALRLVAETLREVGGRQYRPRFRALEPLVSRLVAGERLRSTLSGCLISTREDADSIRITPEPASSRTS